MSLETKVCPDCLGEGGVCYSIDPPLWERCICQEEEQ